MNDRSPPSRKLSVILAADAAGYVRAMAADETRTLAALERARESFRGYITAHGGRVLDMSGDSVLAEFASPVEALNAAIEVQHELNESDADRPGNALPFRIGINLGDVIEQEDAVYGDSVNVAARLQEIADPGGICISGSVFDQVEGKTTHRFRSRGDQSVRNLPKPVRTYQVEIDPGEPHVSRIRRPIPLAAGLVVLLLTVAGAVLVLRPTAPASRVSATDAAFAMPTGPVVAVLPFANLSGDPKQEYFSDGLTEDVITELARFRDIYVLSRSATAEYKRPSIDMVEAGKALRANYLLEGSVRRSSGRLRITAQLIDSSSGAHVWAERYDREASDIFEVQSEIASKIAAAVSGGSQTAIPRATSTASSRKAPNQILAYEHVLQGSVFFSTWTKKNFESSKAHLQKAIELDPDYARARHLYAYALLIGWISHLDESPAPPSSITTNAIKSVDLDPTDYRAHRTAAFGYFFAKNLGLFDRHATRALELAPNDAEMLAEVGALYTFSGNWDKGVRLSQKANSLNPIAAGGWYHSALHYDFFRKHKYREALEIVIAHPEQEILHTQWKYVAAHAELGNVEKAREHYEMCRSIDPAWSADRMRQELRLWNFPEQFIDAYLASYAKAGYQESRNL